MGILVTYQEIVARYETGENAFDLTLEKWVRIRESLEKAFTLSHFKEILDAAVIKVPLCLEYRYNCALCPLEGVCSKGPAGIIRGVHEGDSGILHYRGFAAKVPTSPLGGPNHFGVGGL
jgi:hypothetical protein